MKNLKTNIFFKVIMIVVLVLLLLIPTALVQNLIHERERTQRNAIEEISEKWALEQQIAGPYLSIPYDKYVTQTNAKDTSTTVIRLRKYIHILPDQLNISGIINPEKRYRGIYEVVVYESQLTLSGSFSKLEIKDLDIDEAHIHYDRATISYGISDLKGIENQISVLWNQDTIAFNSGVANLDIVKTGIHTTLNLSETKNQINSFSTNMILKGSQQLYFFPFGKTTDVSLSSDWTTPSFNGEYLPDSREVSESGFKANWNVLHLNRNYPQIWTDNTFNVSGSAFGTDLLLPVDKYKKANRVAKYAILFLGFTFLTFFFVEILNKVFIHPMQYLLVGLALIVFYSLLLSFSEHMLFDIAYALASVLTLILITLYSRAILKSQKLALIVSSILCILYSFIFTIIQLEDYALLIGSIGIFMILAIVMYFSRAIDWYNIRLEE